MNNFYRVVYNHALGLKQVASESTNSGGKGKGAVSAGTGEASGSTKKILGVTAGALALGFGGGYAAPAEAAVVTYDADSSNTEVSYMYLDQTYLGNGELANPTGLAIGSNEYKYAAILFRPDQDGTYVFGQTQSPVDTVMILYTGLFDPNAPGTGGLVGNDDTGQAVHRTTTGDPNLNTLCGQTSYCPQVTWNVQAGQVYTLLVSVFNGSSYNANFGIPFKFYSTGEGSFGSLIQMVPIDTAEGYYLGSDIDFKVERIFKGGTLRMDQADHTFAQDFVVHNIATNTIDQYGNDTVFSGLLSDAVAGEAGMLTIANSQSGGSVTLSGDNTYSGGTTVKDGGVLIVSSDSNLGAASGGLTFDGGTLKATADMTTDRDVVLEGQGGRFDSDKSLTLNGLVQGGGVLLKTGTGTLTLAGAGNTYAGNTMVAGGTLRAGSAGAFSSQSAYSVATGATLDLGGFDQSVASLGNAGTVLFSSATPGTRLTVAGDYVGSGGTLVLNSQLDGDASVTDKLVVQGNTSGETFVQVVNNGGIGAATGNGIQVIDVAGVSDGQFVLKERVVAGAYDYFLHKGGKATPDDGDWYLRSELNTPKPQEPEPPEQILRPEPASYLGNQNAATRMFQHSLHDRAGEPGFTTRDDDGRGYATWVRVQNNQLDASVVGGQIGLDSRANTVQVGGEMQRWTDAGSRLHLGLMGGYGRATTDAVSHLDGFRSKGEAKGTNLGVYGTWYQQGKSATGLYVDSWAQYARFDNTVQGQGLAEESYKSRVWSGSVEAGYAMRINSGDVYGIYVEPQAQVIYTDFSSDDVTEANGTLVQTRKAGGTTTRVGARAYTRPVGGEHNRVQPFVAVNWWSGGNESTIAVDGERLRRDLPKDVYEAKVGAQLELGGGWSGWGQLGYQDGSHGYRDVNGQIGVKLSW